MEISIIISIISVLIALYLAVKATTKENTDAKLRIAERLTTLEGKYEIFWKIIEPHLATIIHSPIHKERDELVNKLVSGTIELGETKTLIPMLQALIEENHNDQKRLAGALLLIRATQKVAVMEKKI